MTAPALLRLAAATAALASYIEAWQSCESRDYCGGSDWTRTAWEDCDDAGLSASVMRDALEAARRVREQRGAELTPSECDALAKDILGVVA